MNKRTKHFSFLWLLLIMLMPISASAKTFMGTINIEVGETYTVYHLYTSSAYTVSGYWTKTDGNAFRITSSSSGNGGCTIVGNQVGTSTLNWWGVVSAGWDTWESECYWTVNVQPAPAPDVVINSTNFPDNNFRQYLLSQYYGEDGKLSEAELNYIPELHIQNKGIENLHGIEYFTGLKKLYCSKNNLQSLDLSANNKLTHVSCFGNQLTTINISNCTELEWLQCPSNKLTALDVSKCNKLNWLDCSYNQLSELDLSENTALETLECSQNYDLTFLNVSGCAALKTIQCSHCNLSSLDLTQTISLTKLNCYYNQLLELNVSNNAALRYLYCGDNSQLTSIDVSKNTNLEELYVGGLKLSELDVTKNTKLTTLSGQGSTIKSLDLSKNTLLTSLSWDYAQLETLNLNNNNALTTLSCSENQITSLDLSNCTQLESLRCDHNQLTSLLLPNSSKLTSFWMDHNQIWGDAMDMFINSLPTNSTNEPHSFRLHLSDRGYSMTFGGYKDNVCTAQQVAAMKAKGWTPLWYNNGGWVEYDGGYDFVIKARDCSREYGEPNPEFEYDVWGGDLTGKPTLSGVVKEQPVGTYSIDVGQGTVQGSVACINGILTVNKAPLTVSVENCTRKEGEPNPNFILHYSGWKIGQDESVLRVKPTASTVATESSPVGNYEIVVTGGVATNYYFNYINGILTVEEKYYEPDNIELPTSQTVKVGETITLTPTVTPANAEYALTWTSDDETVATVNSAGVVMGVKKGQTFINVETDNGKAAYCKLTVTAAEPTGIELPKNATVYVGGTLLLTPTITPEGAETTLTWKSDDETVVRVDATGVLTGLAEGLALVTVKTANGLTSNACKVKVEQDPSGISDVQVGVKANFPVYTLSGQRLAAPRKGINIIGGKKVVVK